MDRKILVAPLNWGLGHASRSIPIIHSLLENNYSPILASDGEALELLTREFPQMPVEELPTYKITYSKRAAFFKFKMLAQLPHILHNISLEKKVLDVLAKKYDLCGIISDNRWGMYHSEIPNVIITHQLRVLSGITTSLTTIQHHYLLKKFDKCWVPDFEHPKDNLSGKLGHGNFSGLNLKYLGALSRFSYGKELIIYDIIVILSGPEPQRSILEMILIEQLKNFIGKVCFIRGTSQEKKLLQHPKWEIHQLLNSEELNAKINQSNVVIARSGYSTIMDLAKLKKRCFLIPTPGQEEQEYLAKDLSAKKMIGTCSQKEFKLEKLVEARELKGIFPDFRSDFSIFFTLFEGK